MSALRLVVCLIAVTLVACQDGGVVADDSDKVLRSLEIWKSSADEIWSYDVYASIRVTSYSRKKKEMMLVGDHEVRQRFMNGMWRVDLLKTKMFFSSGRIDEWDAGPSEANYKAFAEAGDNVVRSHLAGEHFGDIVESRKFTPAKLLANQLFESFKNYPQAADYRSFLAERATISKITSHDSGVMTIRMPSVSEDRQPAANVGIEVDLDDSHGMLPLSIRESADLASDVSDFYATNDNILTEVMPGLWCPTTVVRKIYDEHVLGTNKEPISISIFKVDMTRAKFNIDIPIEVFELKLPKDTVVYDGRTGENYLQSTDGLRDFKDYDGYSRLIQKRARPKARSTPNHGNTTWLIVVNAILVFGVLVIVYMKRRRT